MDKDLQKIDPEKPNLLLENMLTWEAETNFIVDNRKDIVIPKLSKTSTPEEIQAALDKIPSIEKDIKSLSSATSLIKEGRLEMTRKLDPLFERLMYAEKKMKAMLDDAKRDLLPLKIKEEEIKTAKLRRAQELVDYENQCRAYLNTRNLEAETWIHENISKMLSDALESEQEEDWIEVYKDSICEDNFSFSILSSDDKEKEDIRAKIENEFDRAKLYNFFVKELELAFASFDEKLKDKAKALEERKIVEQVAIVESGENKVVEDMFTTNKVVHVDEIYVKTKGLKKAYKLKEGTAPFDILKAFAPKLAIAEKYYKGQRFIDAFEPIIKILENMKNEGVNIDGLTFNEVKKL